MRTVVLAVATLLALPVSAQPAPPAPELTAAECEVWARELSLARSVADRDPAALAAHLH